MPSQIPSYWVRACTLCGIQCVLKSRKPGRGQRQYKAHGLCTSCYQKEAYGKDPTTLMSCKVCERYMVPNRNSTKGKFVKHQGHGMCSACYTRERRINASDDTDVRAGD